MKEQKEGGNRVKLYMWRNMRVVSYRSSRSQLSVF